MPALDINRVRSLLPLGAVWCLLGLCLSGVGQDTVDQSRDSESPPQPEQHRHVPLGRADEFALGTTLDYYEPEPGFNRQNRDIDLQVALIVLAAHMAHGWEFQFDGVALRAHGYRTPASGGMSPEIASNAAALGAGPVARWNFLQFSRVRSFIEAEGNFVLFDRPWPALGTVNDFFLRAGGGVSIRVTDSYWIEPRFLFAHISNGECFCANNPAWNGRGLSLGIRRMFEHSPEVGKTRGRWPFRKADENAWMTGLEDYTPAHGLDRRSGNFVTDMRELRISRAWHFPNHLEFQLGGMVVQSGNTTAGFGPVLRWNLIERERWHLFAAGGFDLLQSGSPAYIIPWRSVGYNFFPRGNVGAGFRISDSYWMDASLGWAHITSGFAGSNQLLPWSGQGVSVALRHTFGTRPAPRL